MRHLKPVLLWTLVIIVVLIGFPAGAEEPKPPRQITVSGKAAIQVEPDEVVLDFAIKTNDMDVAPARQKNNAILAAIKKGLESLGIPEKKLHAGYFSIEPRYESESFAKKFRGYFVDRSFALTLSEIDKFDAVLEMLLQAKTTEIDGVEFRTTKLRVLRDQARHSALVAAREKAEAMAKALGQSIGKPLTINESPEGGGFFAFRQANWMAQNVLSSAGPGGQTEGGTLAPGQIEITAEVVVAFELL